jgi:hypothetical protein
VVVEMLAVVVAATFLGPTTKTLSSSAAANIWSERAGGDDLQRCVLIAKYRGWRLNAAAPSQCDQPNERAQMHVECASRRECRKGPNTEREMRSTDERTKRKREGRGGW